VPSTHKYIQSIERGIVPPIPLPYFFREGYPLCLTHPYDRKNISFPTEANACWGYTLAHKGGILCRPGNTSPILRLMRPGYPFVSGLPKDMHRRQIITCIR
jgi:hypothetical protein